MTKRIVAFAMVVLLAIGLCACGTPPTAEEALNGSEWKLDLTYQEYVIATRVNFNNGAITSTVTLEGSSDVDPATSEGTYVVNEDGTISIHWDSNDNDAIYYYKYENEELRLCISEDWESMEFTRVR